MLQVAVHDHDPAVTRFAYALNDGARQAAVAGGFLAVDEAQLKPVRGAPGRDVEDPLGCFIVAVVDDEDLNVEALQRLLQSSNQRLHVVRLVSRGNDQREGLDSVPARHQPPCVV